MLHQHLVDLVKDLIFNYYGLIFSFKSPLIHCVFRYRLGYLHTLGYLLYLVVRIWGSSFNCIFVDTPLNVGAVCVGVIVCAILYLNDSQSPDVTSASPSQSDLAPEGVKSEATTHVKKLLATGVAFGALLFTTSFLFTDVFITTRWSSLPQPHDDEGPNLALWG